MSSAGAPVLGVAAGARRRWIWLVGGLTLAVGLGVWWYLTTQTSDPAVRATTATIRSLQPPAGTEEWPTACEGFGLLCLRGSTPAHEAAAELHRQLTAAGVRLGELACGPGTAVWAGGVASSPTPREGVCTATARVGPGTVVLTVFDEVPGGPEDSPPRPLGLTVLRVEWDWHGASDLARSDPALLTARTTPAPLTQTELDNISTLVGPVTCDTDVPAGCNGASGTVAPAPRPAAQFEAALVALAAEGFLPVSAGCRPDAGPCTAVATRARDRIPHGLVQVVLQTDGSGALLVAVVPF